MRFGEIRACEAARSHREASGVSRTDQFFRVSGRLAFLKSRLERIRDFKRAAINFQPPTAFGQIA
jgi:hypothetical protein